MADVPITTISGPLGAGKTTLVNHLLSDPGDRRVAVLVNDMGEVNVDAELLADDADDGIVDLSNGCICCRLQDDLVTAVEDLAERRTFDALVVEASGISEPIPIAQALTVGTDADDPPEGFRLDTTVTVVDAYGFWKAFDPDESLPDSAPEPQRPLTEVMVDQIEFCDVLLLNKCDTVPDDALDTIEAELRHLQPRAEIHRTVESEIDPDLVLDTGAFDFEAASRQQGWKRALAGDGHEHDFDAWLDDWDGSIVRAKGFAWVASRPDTVIGMSQAGPAVRAGPIGEWGDDEPSTRLVFIGRDLDRDGVTSALDGFLVDPDTVTPAGDDDPFPRE